MTSTKVPSGFVLAAATASREWLSHRANRFLYWHLGLLGATGVLAVLIAPEQSERGVAWFILSGVLYVLSLSSLLLGLSSAQAETEELPFLATQPMGVVPWVLGKAAGLLTIVIPAAALLLLPWILANGWSSLLAALAAAAGLVCAVFSLLGLAVGLWVHDHVRALIAALALWFLLLFGADLLLLLAAGSAWVRDHPGGWALPLMLNPLDAFRITVMFHLENAAFNTMGAGRLVSWWTRHSALWLACCLAGWTALTLAAAIVAARRVRFGR